MILQYIQYLFIINLLTLKKYSSRDTFPLSQRFASQFLFKSDQLLITVLSSLFRISVDLHDVLEIDPKKMVVRVEPCVTIGKLQATSAQVCDLA